jgi:phospholipid-translocating ATPase
VYQQMVQAVEDFFPESGILDNSAAEDAPAPTGESDEPPQYPLRRIESGISSIVGSNNGDRPGGFVLVIDGAALTHVRIIHPRLSVVEY